MADVLGDALHKLSVARAPLPPVSSTPVSGEVQSPATTPQSATPDIETQASDLCPAACGAAETVEEVTHVPAPVPVMAASDVMLTAYCGAESAEPAVESSSSPPVLLSMSRVESVPSSETTTVVTSGETNSAPVAPVDTKTSFPRTSRWEQLMTGVSEHRRQLAAVVVIICMAGLWFEESKSSKSNSASSDMLTEDFADIEAALSEFDVKSAPAMREPAEPVDTSASPGFDLSIPSDNAFSAASEQSNPSETTATYPDQFGGLEIPANPNPTQQNSQPGSMQSSGFSAAPVSAPAGRNVKAKLSHSIQPIN